MAITLGILGPYGVEMVAEAGTNALHQKPHWLISHIKEALDPKHVVLGGHRFEAGQKGRNILDGWNRQGEAVEVVMVVTFLGIVVRGAIDQIVFGRG